MCHTQVHGLLRGICWNAPEHNAGQHGAKEKRKAAGHTLYTCESAAWRSTYDRKPDMTITEVFGCFHEKQVATEVRKWDKEG